MKYVKGGEEEERDKLGYMCISWRELWDGGTDRWADGKERGVECGEGKTDRRTGQGETKKWPG